MPKSSRRVGLISALSICFGAFAAQAQAPAARAEVKPAPGAKLQGTVSFSGSDKGTKIMVEFKDLKPGAVHGLHIHENGKCDAPGFTSAGGHFNPGNKQHGSATAENKHAGDLGNIVASKDGTAKKELLLKDVDLDGKSSVVGKAVVIHAKPDDLVSQPSGDSGDRIGCGVITTAQSSPR